MKIKTIWDVAQCKFDEAVNAALAEGYVLARRDIVPDRNDLDNTAFYAELVLLDPTPETDPVAGGDPFDLLRQLREFCDSIPKKTCQNGECPLSFICADMAAGRAIDELNIPAED